MNNEIEAIINLGTKATVKEIKAQLEKRSGKKWSVTHGKGTAYGWITIDVPPARRTLHAQLKADATGTAPHDYERVNTGVAGGYITLEEARELNALLGLEGLAHCQGVSIPSQNDYYREYITRARGEVPAKNGVPLWD